MLQRLLIITLTLCSLTASAQWQQTGAKVRYVNGLGIPTKDTAAGVSADSSQILIRPADSSLYIKYKRTWVKVGAGGGGGVGGSGTTNYVPKFTAGTTIGNSSIVDSASAVAMTINTSGNIGVGTTNAPNKFVVSNAGQSGFEVAPTGGVSSGVLLQAYNRNTLAYMAQSYYALGHTWNVGTAAATRAMDIASGGAVLINTTTDNGVDKLQVSGSMSVSARATAQNLSVTNNGSITNDLTVGKTVFCGSSSVDGIVITAANTRGLTINGVGSGGGGASQTRLSFDHNGADRGLFYYDESGETFSFQSSGASRKIQIASEAGVGFYMTGSNTNVRIGDNTAANAKLSVAGTTLINTNTDNGVDKLQVNGSSYYTGQMQQRITSPRIYLDDSDNTGTASLWFRPQSASFLIRGAVELISKGSAAPTEFRISAKDTFTIRSNDVEKLRIPPSGRILANTTTDNTVDQLQVNGSISGIGFKQNYVTKTGAYTATDADYVIDCTSGTFTVTLPASSGRTGRILIIKNSGAGTITVDGNGAETIDGAATYSLAVQYATVQIMSDGTNWKIIAKF
jgi:hypothetical protein